MNLAHVGPSRVVLVILFAYCVATPFATAQRRGGKKPAVEKEDSARTKRAIERLLGGLEPDRSSITSALRKYASIESRRSLGLFGRHQAHEKLLAELRKMDTPDLAKVAKSYLGRKPRRSDFPVNVLLMKTLIGSKFPMSKDERIELLLGVAKSKDITLATWAVRLLADTGWPEAIDALIVLLRAEEDASRHLEDLSSVISVELYRVLGAAAIGSSGAIEKAWKQSGRKLPKKPDYSPAATGGRTGFFGDRISLRAVFCIDISSSMLGEVALRPRFTGKGKTKRKDEKKGPTVKEKKIEIVRRELLRALGGLRPESRFNIVPYDKTAVIWQGTRLLSASSRAVRAAESFARAVQAGRGTNIHDSMVRALEIPEVETIYLLSAGAPSVGGNPDQIRKRVAAMNYLRGARVVTYGFTGSKEDLMRGLASKNWGWFRSLNQ